MFFIISGPIDRGDTLEFDIYIYIYKLIQMGIIDWSSWESRVCLT